MADDKSFIVDGQGPLIVRVDYEDGSVYFQPETDGEQRVDVRGLKVVEE